MSSNNPGCLGLIFGVKKKRQQVRRPVVKPAVRPVEQVEAVVAAAENVRPVPHYASKGILLTNAEASFFHVLRSMAKDYLLIFPHVALRDLVSVVADQSEYYTYFNKINKKQVDFVLCDPQTLKPIFVIELDDASHNHPDRIERDGFVEKALDEAKISLVRIPVQRQYDTHKIGVLFKEAVSKYVENKNEAPNHLYTVDNPPLCPRHDVRMVLRTARQTAERFWGCPNYPYCREIIRLEIPTGNAQTAP